MHAANFTQDDDRIVLSGSLTVKTVVQLFAQPPRFDAQRMHIDLSSVTQVDNVGLALLVHWDNVAKAACNKLNFKGAPVQLQELARITGLQQLFAE